MPSENLEAADGSQTSSAPSQPSATATAQPSAITSTCYVKAEGDFVKSHEFRLPGSVALFCQPHSPRTRRLSECCPGTLRLSSSIHAPVTSAPMSATTRPAAAPSFTPVAMENRLCRGGSRLHDIALSAPHQPDGQLPALCDFVTGRWAAGPGTAAASFAEIHACPPTKRCASGTRIPNCSARSRAPSA